MLKKSIFLICLDLIFLKWKVHKTLKHELFAADNITYWQFKVLCIRQLKVLEIHENVEKILKLQKCSRIWNQRVLFNIKKSITRKDNQNKFVDKVDIVRVLSPKTKTWTLLHTINCTFSHLNYIIDWYIR